MAETDIVSIRSFFNKLQSEGRLLNHRFGITLTKSGMEDIAMYGQSTTIPKREINTASVQYYGQTFDIPTTLDEGGRRWSITMHSDANNDHYNKIREWQEEYASWAKSGGGFKGISNIKAYIDIYNNQMTDIVDSFCLSGIIPLSVGEISFGHAEDGIVSFDVEFLFQYSYNSKRGTDPFA